MHNTRGGSAAQALVVGPSTPHTPCNFSPIMKAQATANLTLRLPPSLARAHARSRTRAAAREEARSLPAACRRHLAGQRCAARHSAAHQALPPRRCPGAHPILAPASRRRRVRATPPQSAAASVPALQAPAPAGSSPALAAPALQQSSSRPLWPPSAPPSAAMRDYAPSRGDRLRPATRRA